VRPGHRGGHGHQQRRDTERSLVQSLERTLRTSGDFDRWPALRWTHELAAELHATNVAAQSAVPGRYVPPPHEPFTEAWSVLDQQRQAEIGHQTDIANDAGRREKLLRQRLTALRRRVDLGPNETLPPALWSAAASIRRGVQSLPMPEIESGATLPLGPRSRVSLDRLREQGAWN